MATLAESHCHICGPGYRYGDEGCRHTPESKLIQHTPVTAEDIMAVEDPAGASALIINLMQRSQADLNNTVNSQMALYRAEAERLAAELTLVRQDIESLLNEPSAPAAWRIEKALYPSAERTKHYRMFNRDNRPLA
jgi:hypothetical protein